MLLESIMKLRCVMCELVVPQMITFPGGHSISKSSSHSTPKHPFTFLPDAVILVLAVVTCVTLVFKFCTCYTKVDQYGTQNFTFEQTFEHSLIRSKFGSKILCATRLICCAYFLVVDVFINLFFIHYAGIEYFTTWNCILLSAYYCLASTASIIGLMQHDCDIQWSYPVKRFGFLVFILFEICGGTVLSITIVTFTLHPRVHFWNSSVHLLTSLSVILELIQNSMHVQFRDYPMALFWVFAYLVFMWCYVILDPLHIWPYQLLDASKLVSLVAYIGLLLIHFIGYCLIYGLSQVQLSACRTFGLFVAQNPRSMTNEQAVASQSTSQQMLVLALSGPSQEIRTFHRPVASDLMTQDYSSVAAGYRVRGMPLSFRQGTWGRYDQSTTDDSLDDDELESGTSSA